MRARRDGGGVGCKHLELEPAVEQHHRREVVHREQRLHGTVKHQLVHS